MIKSIITSRDLKTKISLRKLRAIGLLGQPSPFVRPNESLSVLDSFASFAVGKSIVDDSLEMSDVCVTLLTPKLTGSIFNAALINNFMLNE